MRSILKIEKIKILNLKFKKFKNLKKMHNINKIKLSNFFMAKYHQIDDLCQRIMLLEPISGEIFKINKFKFYNNNKKHVRLGALIFLKVHIFKKKVLPCLSYFFIYQLFFYYEFFLKAKTFNSNEFCNYCWAKPILFNHSFITNFNFFMCWSDFDEVFSYSAFEKYTEVFDEEEEDQQQPIDYVDYIQIDMIVFYKFSKILFKTLLVIKKNLLKLLIFFYKKFFFRRLLFGSKSKKLKLFLAKKFIIFKKNAKT